MKLYTSGVVLVVVFEIYLLPLCVKGCGRSKCNRPAPDKTKPTIKCPKDINKLADDKQIFSTDVIWTEPGANDNRDGPITPTRTGLGPGKVFYENDTRISYTAKDRSGNHVSCSFNIYIKVERCLRWTNQNNGWISCDPSHDMMRGTECRFGCYSGFELVGSSVVKCICQNMWSENQQPFCKAVTCDRLLEADDKTKINCTDNNNYRSICYYSCIDGFGIHPGVNRARVCSADGTWTGHAPKCQDTSPPEFIDCPSVIIGYAESSKASGRLTWNVPKFTDNYGNGGVTLTQIAGPRTGDEVAVGEYSVRYEASDKDNNTAVCEFKAVLKQITCHILYPKPYTYVTCPNGRRFGSVCEFSCRNGTALSSPAVVQCERFTHGNVRYGRWSFGDTQPACNLISSCEKPEPPNNGALVCDTWAGGKFCQIQCREGYLIKHDIDSLLTCGDLEGKWDQLEEDEYIPDCNKATAVDLILNLKLEEYYYFDGNCSSSSEEIKDNFLDSLQAAFGDICSNSGCSVSDVEVVCGIFTNRRKRSIAGTESNIIIKSNIKLNGNQSDTVTLMNTRTSMLKKLKGQAGNFTIVTSTGTAHLQSFEMSQPEPACQTGFYSDMYSMTCVECMPGSYHDVSKNICTKCPRGQYQPAHAQTTCVQCPHGNTTEKIGATDRRECVDACPPGFFSFNGVPPCSPCDKGTYTSEFGADECTTCPGSKTTSVFDTTASSSVDACFDFDINFAGINSTEQTASIVVPLQQAVTAFHFGVWIQCRTCNKIVQVTDDIGDFKFEVVHSNTLSIILNGCEISTNITLNTGTTRWHFLLISVNVMHVIINVDDVKIENSPACTSQNFNLTSSLNVTFGEAGFQGSLTQLNIWQAITDIQSYNTVKGCHDAPTGDVLSWRQFQDVEGAFTISSSLCDAIDECLSNPCRGQGLCIDGIDSFTCICNDGFDGDTCQENIDDCFDNSCENGATCQDETAGYTCICKDGYSGLFCEVKVVDGSWTQWESWGPCSVTCGNGTYTRTRVCADPSPDNDGKYCEGDASETATCTMTDTCHNECNEDPPPLNHGNINCSWVDSDQTVRSCYPTCDVGYAFDSDLFLDEIICGPQTGYIWNVRNDQNPDALIPACTEIENAKENVLVYPGEYRDLTPGTVSDTISDVNSIIHGAVADRVSEIDCIKNESCSLKQLEVTNTEDEPTRRKRDITLVGFVLEISCSPLTSVHVCYDLLLDVKNQLDAIVNNTHALSVNVDHVMYDVIYNSTSASGRSLCKPGTVPVDYFCIQCGPGSYQVDVYCERCPKGTYQDVPGAVGGCKVCPDRWTTQGLQTRSETKCNVRLPDDRNLEILPIIIVIVVVVTTVIIVLITRGCQKSKRGVFSLKRVNRIDVMPAVDEKWLNNSNKRFAWRDFNPLAFASSEYPSKQSEVGLHTKS